MHINITVIDCLCSRNFVKSRNSPQVKSQNSYKLDCSNTLIAFRVCRKSCGFCSNDERNPAHAVYNFKLANDAWRCRNPAIGIVQESGRNQTIKSIFLIFLDKKRILIHMLLSV